MTILNACTKKSLETYWMHDVQLREQRKIPNYFVKVYYLGQQKNVDPVFSLEGMSNSLLEFR